EHRQGQRRDVTTRYLVGNNTFGLLFDHVDKHFYGNLETARHTCASGLGRTPQDKHHDRTHQNRPEQRVVVNNVEIGDDGLFFTCIVQMNQVMLNILRLRRNITSSSHLNPYPVSYGKSLKPLCFIQPKTLPRKTATLINSFLNTAGAKPTRDYGNLRNI